MPRSSLSIHLTPGLSSTRPALRISMWRRYQHARRHRRPTSPRQALLRARLWPTAGERPMRLPAPSPGQPLSFQREKVPKRSLRCRSQHCGCHPIWWIASGGSGFERIGRSCRRASRATGLALRSRTRSPSRSSHGAAGRTDRTHTTARTDRSSLALSPSRSGPRKRLPAIPASWSSQLCQALEAKGLGARRARSPLPSRRQPHRGHPRRHGAASSRHQAPDPPSLRQDRNRRSGLRRRDHEPCRFDR